MKAIRMHAFGGPDVLRLDEVDVPEPGAGQVLIKVVAAGVTFGDVMKRRGAFGQDVPLPSGLGIEVSGTVAGAGRGGNGLATGAPVMAWVEHGYAEYAVAPAAAVVPLPDGVDLRTAAALPVKGLTAYQTLRDAGGLGKGESVLVHAAAGGVGTLAVQLASSLGARTVVGTTSQPRKLDHVHALGAVAVDYSRDDWPQQVLAATDGRGVDLVLDSVGGDTGARSFECLAPFGRMVSFGASSGAPVDVPGMALMHNNASIIGYSLMGWMQRPEQMSAAVEELLNELASGRLQVSVDALPLAQAAEAHRAIDERSTLGSTVLLP
jgi:NADPH2:quinone reductase